MYGEPLSMDFRGIHSSASRYLGTLVYGEYPVQFAHIGVDNNVAQAFYGPCYGKAPLAGFMKPDFIPR